MRNDTQKEGIMIKRMSLVGVVPGDWREDKIVALVKHDSYYILATEYHLYKIIGEHMTDLKLTYVTEEEE